MNVRSGGKVAINKIQSFVVLTIGGPIAFAGINLYLGNDKFYRDIVMPVVHKLLKPERAHRLAIWCAKHGLVPHQAHQEFPVLKTTVMGLEFDSPVGLAAGFDKDGQAFCGLGRSGLGFVEIGSVTPKPQPGNPKPRVFRLTEDQAVINRYGFNSLGHQYVLEQVKAAEDCKRPKVLGINLGKNKTSEDAAKDYVDGVKVFAEVADYLVINVSSPNTPGLRALQHRNQLETLVDKVLNARNAVSKERKVPILLKIAPDLTVEDKKDIASVATRKGKELDGLIICNTTIQRPSDLKSKYSSEIGGLSGRPLKNLSTSLIRDMYNLTGGKIPIIGVGGVFSGEDAYEKICAGASLVQIYSSFIYEGPPVVNRIKKELADILTKHGYSSVKEIVGSDHKK